MHTLALEFFYLHKASLEWAPLCFLEGHMAQCDLPASFTIAGFTPKPPRLHYPALLSAVSTTFWLSVF